jgi:hypothetical protein
VRRVVVALLLPLALAAATVSPAATQAKPLTMQDRVLRTGELAGYKRFGPATSFIRARSWVSSGTGLTLKEVAARVARLNREGFVTVLSQQLAPIRGSRDRGGLSWAMRLKSPAAARNELAAIARYSQADGKGAGRSFKPFRVTGIPRARGFRLAKPGIAGDNVVFADGRYVYLVSTRWETYAQRRPARAALLAAARKLYRRVHAAQPA